MSTQTPVTIRVIAIDIEKYSLRNSNLQSKIIKEFTAHLKDTQNKYRQKNKITLLPTGDGLAVVFEDILQSNPAPLKFALSLLKKIKNYNNNVKCRTTCEFEFQGFCTKCKKYNVRIGIDGGDVIKYNDINGNNNFAGTPLNNAFRIMGHSYRNKLAISKNIFDSIAEFHRINGFDTHEYDELVKHGKKISIYRYNPSKAVKGYGRRLNALFNTRLKSVKFVRELVEIPLLSLAGGDMPEFEAKLKKWLGKNYQDKIGRIKDNLKTEGRLNDPHAISAKIEDSRWDYYATDYATIKCLRDEGKKPEVIYATVIVFCIEKKEIYLHKRKKGTQYAGCYHVFGGGFMPPPPPPNNLYSLSDKESLLKTAMREILEETGLSIQWNKKVKMVYIKPKAGGDEFVLLGVNVTTDNVEHASKTHKETWEGEVKRISFDKLRYYLLNKNNRWCPTGMVVLLSWLALGASGCEPETQFGRYTAQELFEDVLKQLEERQKKGELLYNNKKGLYYVRGY